MYNLDNDCWLTVRRTRTNRGGRSMTMVGNMAHIMSYTNYLKEIHGNILINSLLPSSGVTNVITDGARKKDLVN